MPVLVEASDSWRTVLTRRRTSLTRSGLVIGAAVAWGTALNILFHFVLAHILRPGEYSLLASGATLVFIVTVPTVALQAAVAREVAAKLDAGLPDEAGVVL